jgi:hypothetical protein
MEFGYYRKVEYVTLTAVARIHCIFKKSSSPAFKGAQTGDIIDFRIPIAEVGRTRRSTHAAFIDCINRRTGETSNLSFNQLGRILTGYEMEQLI